MSQLFDLSLTRVRDLLRSGEVTAEAATAACLERIAATEPAIDALLHVAGEAALDQARAMDQAGPDAGRPLWGVPVTVKDVLATEGLPTTCGSRILENFVPVYDAHCVSRLKEAGAIIIGKANMDEFAMGSSTENSAYKVTKNPWNTGRVPGGSSGGSAASVAAGQCFASIGTDTGGSIRQPASFCGIVGLKPGYGRVSRRGLVAYGSSLDQAGPMTRTVADAALILQVIAGHDPKDSTSLDAPVPNYLEAIRGASLKGLRLGLPEQYWGEGLSAEVDAACRGAVDLAASLGAEIVPVSLPHTEYAIATYYILAMAEASSNLARFDGVRYGLRSTKSVDLATMYTRSRCEGFGEEVMRRIMLGTYVLSAGYYDAYYKKAAQVRRLIRQDFLNALGKCDLICGPACPTTAFAIGENTADPLQMYLTDIFTISLNLSGLPGMSLPVGLGRDTGMPVGLQLFAGNLQEAPLLAAAAVLEANLPAMPAPPIA
ncbi:Asp-tRNA(Asn)/Glu-tRNA(Gln) amidotransferase subunit GatA [Desulfomicrobium escambiense]|uniref:Asp-tRNA(Asn)/Glu-tRNA(Gln) amidotransferase subunit GatA n=1 Tax=Desulfomicrobium escambiense TaxID=29503 RepID=UPI000413C462|nr:Asp-tRNA(Asn)/Glu-tRNA(Gln) amidotransferase subunit GatA [Desulfomicrobium escambiense]